MEKKINPNKKYEFSGDPTSKINTRLFYTKELSEDISKYIKKTKSKSYLELGCGFCGVMVIAGLALKEVNGDDYSMIGVDMKAHRMNYGRQLLSYAGLKAAIIQEDLNTWRPNNNVDILFIDCGYGVNQLMLDRFSPHVNKMIFLHDVTPEGLIALVIPNNFVLCSYSEKKKYVILWNPEIQK